MPAISFVIARFCLVSLLYASSEALKWDAEFPTFYATRAKINYRMGELMDAIVDLKTAVELARYGQSSGGVREDLLEWSTLLERWEINPSLSGSSDFSGGRLS